MKSPALLFSALILLTPLHAADPALPEEVIVAGASVKTDGCCLAWKPDAATEITGRYECASITDGSSTLEIKATGEGDDIVLSGKIDTKWADRSTSTITFSRGELSLKEVPHFTAARGVITGWLVQFKNPDRPKTGLQPAIILGDDVYVRVK